MPKLQLNKVELHFDYQTSGRITHQNLTPMLYGHPRFNPFQGRLGINNRVQHITTVMNPMNQDQSTRTTKMINIEMQTDGKRKITESKLNIVTQEKSVQDTLYDTMNPDAPGSQKWMISNKNLDDITFGGKTSDKVQVTDSRQSYTMNIKN